MATTATPATIMPAFAPVLRALELVSSVAGCGEIEGKDDEDTVVTDWFALMFMDLGAMNTLGRDDMRLMAMERLESDDVRLFAVVAAVFTLNIEELLVLDVIVLDAAGAPRLLAMSASGVEVVGLGSGRGAQTTGG